MKYHETKFEDYVLASENNNLHNKNELLDKKKLITYDLNTNLILYGPSGTGKYTQALNIIKNFSPSGLKYERKLNIENIKNKIYFIKISDIHYEIDMELLGCNAKNLWNDIFKSILDILSSKPMHKGIILCKNFHMIHTELLDIFYSYMQSLNYKKIKMSFILLTEHISFIPENILNKAFVIPVNRPRKSQYKKIFGAKNLGAKNLGAKNLGAKNLGAKNLGAKNLGAKNLDAKNLDGCGDIINIKALRSGNILNDQNKIIVSKIVKFIKDKRMIDLEVRNTLYNILIYQLDIYSCIWDIISKLVEDDIIKDYLKLEEVTKLFHKFLKLYNNNYRPIYHLERFFLNLIIIIHDIR